MDNNYEIKTIDEWMDLNSELSLQKGALSISQGKDKISTQIH